MTRASTRSRPFPDWKVLGPFLAKQSGDRFAPEPLPLGAHPELPDLLLRVFRYAQGISGRKGGIFVIESNQFLPDECRRVSPFRRPDLLAFTNSSMFACSEAVIPSDSESRKAGCCIAVSNDSFIRPPGVVRLSRESSATLAFVNSFRPTYSLLLNCTPLYDV
jgi:hypothetical protein